MPLPKELVAAYERAEYVVFGEPPLVLRIGEPSRRLDTMLAAAGKRTAAFVTPCNPRSEKRTDAQNQAAFVALERSLEDQPFGCYPGEGRDPQGGWPAEPSLLILGIPRGDAAALGRAFGQNAIVFFEKGAAGELVLLA
jgi:hypothetical protein